MLGIYQICFLLLLFRGYLCSLFLNWDNIMGRKVSCSLAVYKVQIKYSLDLWLLNGT